MSGIALSSEVWWYATRATGIVAWIASLGSLLLGTALATRVFGSRPKGPWVLDLHRGLAGITVAATASHVGALVADSYVHFGAADVLVPFASDWRPGAVAGGVVAMWLLAVVEVTSLAKRRLSKTVWRTIHLSSYGAGAAATLHAFTTGTDAGNPAMVAVAVVTVLALCFLFGYRAFAPSRPARTIPPRPTAASSPEQPAPA